MESCAYTNAANVVNFDSRVNALCWRLFNGFKECGVCLGGLYPTFHELLQVCGNWLQFIKDEDDLLWLYRRVAGIQTELCSFEFGMLTRQQRKFPPTDYVKEIVFLLKELKLNIDDRIHELYVR